ncbi:MAG: [protein-PII] uridylyltransferase [Pseudomonadota bacterium]
MDETLNAAFHDQVDISRIVHGRAQAMDQLVVALWRRILDPSARISLLAVGGYGRGELHPFSDIDLLILLPNGKPPEAVSGFITQLWDLRLEVGHSVRTVKECVKASRDDVSTATTLMETRLLAGDEILPQQLRQALSPKRIWRGEAYFRAKLAEQKTRHKRFGGTAYNLEPNVKEGPGGLRDIQTIAWVAKRHYGAESLLETARAGFLTEEEYQAVMEGQRYLWRVRYGLHLAAKRKENRLLFAHQRELAAQFGFADVPGANLAVEQFMQDYFRRVMQLERLNERLLQAFDEDILGRRKRSSLTRVDDDFQVRQGYLEFARPNPLPENPLLLLRLFRVLQEIPELRGVRADTLRQLRASRSLIDESFRRSLEARQIFGDLWRDGRRLPEILEKMHRYEVLDAYLPVFRQIVGRMQFDLFHVFTVDQHTLEVMKYVHYFATRRDDKTYPMAHDLFRSLAAPEILYLGAFFHDIAKGRGGDHSELGEQDARTFCADHGFSESDSAQVAWLVRHHLLMSMTAQRQDIADPAVVAQFSELVGTRRRLDLLYLLTLADISGTSIKLWNSWKARLLSQLYVLTVEALERGPNNLAERSDTIADTRARASVLLEREGIGAAARETLWGDLSDEYFLRHTPDQVAWHTQELMIDGPQGPVTMPLVAMRQSADSGAAELMVYAPNIEGTFASIVDCLGRSGLSVVDARGFTTADGHVLDTFLVLDASGSATLDKASVQRLNQRVLDRLRRLPDFEPTNQGSRMPARLKPFQRRPNIWFRPDAAGRFTEMEVFGSDRPGLLAIIAGTLMAQKVRIHGVRVVTLGDRVEDVFVISDRDDRPLDEKASHQLETAIQEALENA